MEGFLYSAKHMKAFQAAKQSVGILNFLETKPSASDSKSSSDSNAADTDKNLNNSSGINATTVRSTK